MKKNDNNKEISMKTANILKPAYFIFSEIVSSCSVYTSTAITSNNTTGFKISVLSIIPINISIGIIDR